MDRNSSVAVRPELSLGWSIGRSMARDQRLICLPGLGAARETTGGLLGVVCQCQVELSIVPIASRPLSPACLVATLIELHETFSRLNSGDTSVGCVISSINHNKGQRGSAMQTWRFKLSEDPLQDQLDRGGPF
jgi:hypothetical protein